MKVDDILNHIQSDNQQDIQNAYATLRNQFIFRLIKELQCSPEDAEDIYQDTFLILIEQVNQHVEIKKKLPAYLFGIARNLVLTKRRKRKVHADYEEKAIKVPTAIDGYAYLEDKQGQLEHEIQKVKRSIEKLGASCLRLLTAFYFYQKPMKQIAHEFEYTNEKSVKSQKARCVKKLRKIHPKRE